MSINYENQVRLLVRCIPIISEYDCFALKGGTAINLFYRNLPRLSVDIDLVYINNKPRKESFEEINSSLNEISSKLRKYGIFNEIQNKDGIQKIIASDNNSVVKIEPNYLNRGICFSLNRLPTCEKVQEKFGFAEINVISKQELFGGKICAALDRQHPRDLFDVSLMLKNNEIDNDIKNGFIIELLCHNRNAYELLNPNIKDRKEIFNSQFSQMTTEPYTYSDHIKTFSKLVSVINQKITQDDRNFIIDFISLKTPIEESRFAFASELPAIKWKIRNLETLRTTQPKKFEELVKTTTDTILNFENLQKKREQSHDDDFSPTC